MFSIKKLFRPDIDKSKPILISKRGIWWDDLRVIYKIEKWVDALGVINVDIDILDCSDTRYTDDPPQALIDFIYDFHTSHNT